MLLDKEKAVKEAEKMNGNEMLSSISSYISEQSDTVLLTTGSLIKMCSAILVSMGAIVLCADSFCNKNIKDKKGGG